MTGRERFLLGVLGWTLGAVLVLVAGVVYFDRVQSLDRQLVKLQKQASQLQQRVAASQDEPLRSSPEVRRALSWEAGTLPDPLVLAKTTKDLFSQWGIRVVDFHVVEASAGSFRLRYGLEAPMARFLGAFMAALSADSHLVSYGFSASLGEQGIYHLIWEFGYVSRP